MSQTTWLLWQCSYKELFRIRWLYWRPDSSSRVVILNNFRGTKYIIMSQHLQSQYNMSLSLKVYFELVQTTPQCLSYWMSFLYDFFKILNRSLHISKIILNTFSWLLVVVTGLRTKDSIYGRYHNNVPYCHFMTPWGWRFELTKWINMRVVSRKHFFKIF